MAHRIPASPADVARNVGDPAFPGALMRQEEDVGYEEEDRVYELRSGRVLRRVLIYFAEPVMPRAA